MTCKIERDANGKVVAISCSSPWGMGVTTLEPEDAAEFGMDSVYGFSHGGNPHNFSPDYECNTKEEIAAWEEAKAAWDAAKAAEGYR
jgi:hypothetical protein